MLSQKLEDIARDNGFNIETVEVSANQVPQSLASGHFDCICYASPIHGSYDIPVINGIGLLTGIGEEEVIAQILSIAKGLRK